MSTKTRRGCAGHGYVTFFLAGKEYGLRALNVRDDTKLFDFPPKFSCALSFVRDLPNWLGTITPIIDLRMKFGLRGGHTKKARIIFVETTGIKLQIGMIVDSISTIFIPGGSNIEVVRFYGTPLDPCISGVYISGGRRVFLVDLSRLMSSGEMGVLCRLYAKHAD